MHEPAIQLPEEILEVREEAKGKLYLGVLAIAKGHARDELKKMGKDTNVLREIVDLHRAANFFDENWVDPAIEEISELLHGDVHLARQFLSIYVIESQADKICATLYKLHELDELPTKAPKDIAQLRTTLKDYTAATQQMTNLVSAMGCVNKTAAAYAVESYVEELVSGMGGKPMGRTGGRG